MFDRAWSISEMSGGRWEGVNTRRTIRIVLDLDAFDMHLDSKPSTPTPDLLAALEQLERAGLCPIDETECPPEDLEDGWTRVYLRPIQPWDDQHVATLMEVG